ncbi:MAG: hypothetical protein CFE44_15325 [Burkholderiales bacterium PBB4]|nr:MAG: hypothetical protein CFE44_15325 [Burkholderiales bacterium PBB4]
MIRSYNFSAYLPLTSRTAMNSRFIPVARLISSVALAFASMSAAHAEGRFVISADGQEVTDTQTKLVWQRCAVGQKWDGKTCAGKASKVTLAAAKDMAAGMTPAWRVPTKDELTGIVDKSQKKPAIDKLSFPGTPSIIFWSTRPEASDNLAAWLVDFKTGKVLGHTHKAKYAVRLVRAA